MSPKTLQFEILKGMGRFYSWKYILRNLVKFDLHYAAVGLFGKWAVNKKFKEVSTVKTIVGPAVNLFEKAQKFMGLGKCKVFYKGSVKHPF